MAAQAPDAARSDYDTYVEKHRRWNFTVNVADLSAVNLAKSFIFTTTVLTLYASYLTSSGVLIGLIPAIQQVGYLLPQLLMARRAEQHERKKPSVVRISVVERLPYLFVTIGIFAWPNAPSWAAYLILAVSIAMATGSAGLASPGWKAMLGKVIHPNRRGLLFGLGFSIGGFLGVAGSLAARRILDSFAYPFSFALCFLLSFVFQAVSWFFLTLNREPPRRPEVASKSGLRYLKELPEVLRANPNFAAYLVAMYLIILGGMGISFYMLYARTEFVVHDGFAGTLTLIAMASQSLGTPLLGAFGDRLGHKRLATLGALLGMAAAGMMLFIPGLAWMYPVFVLMNLSLAGTKIADASITMEFSSVDRLPTYTALAGTLLGIPTFIAPVLGGLVLDLAGYRALFAASLVVTCAGLLVLLFRVVDPRVASRRRP